MSAARAMAHTKDRFLVGIDTGGTFTDLVAYDTHSGTLSTSKTPSVPGEPGQALLDAVQAADLAMSEIAGLVHGTTVGTNALIERTGARVLLLVTAGHEDIPYIQRINRKTLYDLRWQKPKPLLASRRDSIGVRERVGSEGQVIRALDVDALLAACREVRERPIEAVAISLLFSYVNPEHERQGRSRSGRCAKWSRGNFRDCRSRSRMRWPRSGGSTSERRRRSLTPISSRSWR